MNLHQLETFVAVAETGSFSRAADSVLLTQSTVSQHIAALENEVGVRLFDRTGRGAELTDAGQLYRQHVRQVLAECADLRHAMARFRGLEDPQLIVGASNVPANYLIPRLLPKLAARYPGIALSVVAGDSREIIDRLVAGEVAMAVVGGRFINDAVEFMPLVVDTMLLVVGKGHPWWARRSVTPEELAGSPLVARESGSGSGSAVDQALQQAGIEPESLRIAARFGSNEAVKQAVVGGFGYAFLSSLSVEQELVRGELVVVEVEGIAIERRFWLVVRRDRTLSPAAQSFAALLKELYRDPVTADDAPPGAPMPGRST